jgi:hypothetical protein
MGIREFSTGDSVRVPKGCNAEPRSATSLSAIAPRLKEEGSVSEKEEVSPGLRRKLAYETLLV